jgi:hypothetical protein
MPSNKILKIGLYSLAVVLLCNLLFATIYSASTFIPKSKVISSLQKSQIDGTLKTPVGSIERSTTGLGLDYGTECVAISIGLKNAPKHQETSKYLSRFYDSYLGSGENIGVFDPCSGLVQLIDSQNQSIEESELLSYARNWWGMSVMVQLGILLFGLATTKIYLFIMMVLALCFFYFQLTKYHNDWKVGLFLLAPFILFADFQEQQNSFPFALFTLELFLSGFLIMYYLNRGTLNLKNLLYLSLIFGSVYNFIFWLNFHLVLTLVPILIFTALFRIESMKLIYLKISIFLFGFVFGFISTTLIKWILSVAIYGDEVWKSIKVALDTRLGTSGLNGPLSEYSADFEMLPVPLRAIVLNCMVAASKVIDPRNASLAGVVFIITVLLGLVLYYLKFINLCNVFVGNKLYFAIPVFLIPYLYYMLTPNHSFNHAVLSYRAVPLSIGFLFALGYLSRNKIIEKN